MWRQRHACQPAFHLRRIGVLRLDIAISSDASAADWRHGQTRNLQRDMSHLTLEMIARTLLDVDVPGWTADARSDGHTHGAVCGRASLYGMVPWPPEHRGDAGARRPVNRTLTTSPEQCGTKGRAAGRCPKLYRRRQLRIPGGRRRRRRTVRKQLCAIRSRLSWARDMRARR